MLMQGDVRELTDCQKAVAAATDKWGRLDILVNAAAGNFLAPAEVLSPKGFKTGIALSPHLFALGRHLFALDPHLFALDPHLFALHPYLFALNPNLFALGPSLSYKDSISPCG